MASIEQVLPLSGPMVDHIDSSYVQSEQGVVKMRTNMRPDFTGSLFANVPVKGTVLLSQLATLPAGTNRVLGWCRDNENNGVIYFVWNSNSNHSIFRTNIITDEITTVFLSEPTLGFTENTIINAQVADGRLYWNDNVSEPKSFNIQKAINYTAGLTTNAYTEDDEPFDTIVFPLIKTPPRFAPEVVYESLAVDPENNLVPIDFNNLRKKQWQIKYNYGYEDYQESAYSSISKVTLPVDEVSAAGVWDTDITKNNALKVTINTGNHNVKTIYVAARDASLNNSAPFFKFKKVDKYVDDIQVIDDNVNYDVYFLNDKYLENIDTSYGNAYCHDVPLTAKDLILLDGKYLAMSMPKKGYDFKDTDLTYSLTYTEEDTEFETSSVRMSIIKDENWELYDRCGVKSSGKTTFKIYVPNFVANTTYRMTINVPPAPDGYSAVPDAIALYTTGATEPDDFKESVASSLADQLREELDRCATIPITFENGTDYVKITFGYRDHIVFTGFSSNGASYDQYRAWHEAWKPYLRSYSDNIYGDIVISELSPTYKSLKRGQYHSFGIVYNDGNGRNQIVFGDKRLYVPPFDSTNLTKIVKPIIIITSVPPIWATTYRVVYIPFSSYLYTMYVPNVQVVSDAVDVPGGQSFLKINQSILEIIKYFPNSIIEAYVWQNGDRIRQVGATDSYEILNEFTRTYTDGDTEVTETGFIVDADFDLTGDLIDLIEIYRPNRTPQDKIYYEIGEEFEILNPGESTRAHAGTTRNQDFNTILPAAISTLDFGDVYFRQRYAADVSVGYILVEDNNFSDFYISSGIDIGRSVIKTESKQSILKRIVLSENYIANTKLNRLNVFLPETEFYTVSENYGDITRILERGDTLKIIQPHRETSVYIGKNYAKDGNGGDIVLATDRVFGSVNPYESYAGSSYPRSVASSDSYVYFFDHINGDFYRSSTNGTASISKEYGMNTWFDGVSGRFRAYIGIKDIITFFEAPTETVWLSFIMGTTIETIVFSESETSKGFIFTVEINNGTVVPENMAWYGDFTYIFSNGRVHKLGAGAYNSFLGSARKTASITFVGNQYPQLQKTFEVLSLNADGDWAGELIVDSDNNYPFGQKTKLFAPRFQKREGVQTAGIPMNIINRVGVEDLNKLYSGNKMVGNAVKVSVESGNFGVLREVKLKSLNSK